MSDLPTICTWFWRQPDGRAGFAPEHILIWAAMVRRNLSMPHRLAVATHEDIEVPGVEIIRPPREFEDIRIPSWGKEKPQCLRRLVMYRPDAAQWFGNRIISMDLDCVISGPLDPMFDRPEDFMIAKGTAASRPFNGSLQMLTAGSRAKVYHDFTPEGAAKAGQKFVGSDQAWIMHCLGPNERVWDESDGLCWYRGPRIEKPRIMFFPGDVKPWALAELGGREFVEEHYRGERDGRCLVLGYDETLWSDVEREISQPFEAVVASPEAAEHWPGPVLAVANSNDEAIRLAQMHGFTDLALCGMREAA